MASGDAWRDRIVVGIDGSEASRQAAGWAAKEATLRGLGLTLAYAILPPVGATAFGPGIPVSLDALDEIRQAAAAELAALARQLAAADVQCEIEVGSPSGVLLAASESAAMLVMGSRGLGGFRGLLLGSVSTQVTGHADCPVVVIRADAPAEGTTIVIGIDGSQAAQDATGFAFDMASRHGWALRALHAWDVPSYDLLVVPNTPIPVPLSDVADDEIRLAAEVLAGFQAEYPDVRVEQRLIRGPAAKALLDAAADAAMIVVGTRGHGQVIGALLGSVSNAVLHRASVPVAVVPHLPTPDDAA